MGRLERIQIVRRPVNSTRRHYVTEDDIRTVLSRFPEELLARLRKVHLNDSSMGARVLGYTTRRGRREISICAQPHRISMGAPRGTDGPEAFGAIARSQWPVRAIRRYLLYNVLLHEVGHLQVVLPEASDPRRKFADETKAQEFADVWRRKLWAEFYDHPDPVHNRPSMQEMMQLRAGWVDSHLAYRNGMKIHEAARGDPVLEEQLGGYRTALSEYLRAIDLYPDHALALEAAGELLYILSDHGDPERELERAEEHLRRAIAIDAALPSSWLYRGMTLARLGRREESREAFLRAIELDPYRTLSATVYGEFLIDWGEWDEAERVLGSVLRKTPDLTLALRHHAKSLLCRPPRKGDTHPPEAAVRKAVAQLQKVLEAEGADHVAHRWLAQAYLHLEGHERDARRHIEACLEIAPLDEVARSMLEELPA